MSEWLGKFDATTTLEDVITRPSAFNPYPEHADGGMEVWAISNPTTNPLYTVRYPKIDAGCRVILPTGYEESEDKRERPELLEGSTINGGSQQVAAADPENWTLLADFWDRLSVNMASEYLIGEGYEKGAGKKVGDLIVANALVTSSDEYVSPEPRAFVRQAVATVRQEIQEGRPEVGYAITNELFRGIMSEHDGRTITNVSTMEWVTDGLPHLLFPNFVESWRQKLDPHKITTVAHPYEIGNRAASIVRNILSGIALNGWMEGQSSEHPEAVVEKMASLQQRIAEDAVVGEAVLRVQLDEATRRFPEAIVDEEGYLAWSIPYPLGKFVMSVISSAD